MCVFLLILSVVLQSSAVPSLTQTALSRGHHMLSLSNYFTNRSETAFVSVAAGSEGYPGLTTPKHWGKLFGSQPWGHISGSGDNFIIHITLRNIEFFAWAMATHWPHSTLIQGIVWFQHSNVKEQPWINTKINTKHQMYCI